MMLKRWAMTFAVLALLLPAMGLAQDNDKKTSQEQEKKAAPAEHPWSFYKLDITMREIEEGKTVNARSYVLMVRTEDWDQLRVGSRIPMGKEGQFQYYDVGLNMDCQVREHAGDASLSTRIELSNVANDPNAPNALAPVIRQIRSSTQTQLVMGKPVVISSLDDVVTKRRFVFEVTANRQLAK